MRGENDQQIDQRTFVEQVDSAVLAVGPTAKSYRRILGANDRIQWAQLRCGERSHSHAHMVELGSKQTPVETVAVCDLWSVARERRPAQVKQAFELEPKLFKYSEDMLACTDIDGVMIATQPNASMDHGFSHALVCIMAAQSYWSGKRLYWDSQNEQILGHRS